MINKTNKLPSTSVNGCGKLVLDYESVNEAFFFFFASSFAPY
jgi:hypothetical protein